MLNWQIADKRTSIKGLLPLVMQKLAGHDNPNIALGIHAHVSVEEKRAAKDTLQEAFA